MDQWYEAVFGLPLSWPEITAMNPEYMHPVSASCFHDLRKTFRVPGMWGKFVPDWNLLSKHLYNSGPNTYTEEERAEKLAPSKYRFPNEVLKDTRRPGWQKWAWSDWRRDKELMESLQQEESVVEFPKVDSICEQILAVARKDANDIELQYRKRIINNEGLPGKGKRQRKESETATAGLPQPVPASDT